jgi:RNA polymerase sigma factor (sigma-70 family)
VLRYCLRCLRRPADAEDALQQTFLQAHRALDRGVEPEAEAAWLLAIARNVCLTRSDVLKRRARTEVLTETDAVADAVSEPSPDDELSTEVRGALAALPGRQRDALFLREWHELSYAEIASVLGITESAVETLVFRARRNLAQRLEPMRRRRALDLVGLLGLSRTGFGSVSAKLAIGAAAATVTAGTAVTVFVERDPPPRHVSKHAPAAVAVARVAPAVQLHVQKRHVVHSVALRKARHSKPGQSAATVVSTPAATATPVASQPVVPSTPTASASAPPPTVDPATRATSPLPQSTTTTVAATVDAATTAAASVVSQTASTPASTVDAVGDTVAATVPAAAPVTAVVTDTVDKTATTVSQTADAAASTAKTTVSKLLPGH